MRTRWNRTGAEVGVAVAIVAITLATWVAAGVFRPAGLLHSFSQDATVGRATRQIAVPSPAQLHHDPRDTASSQFVDPGVVAALTAHADRPAQIAAPRPVASPVAAPLPLGQPTVDPAAGRLTASTPAPPVSAPFELSIDAGPILAPVTNTVGGLVDTVGGAVGGLLGGRR